MNKINRCLTLCLLLICFSIQAADVKTNTSAQKIKTVVGSKAVDLLVEAIFELKIDKVKKQLKKIAINDRDQQGMTALMAAATVGDVQILNLILIFQVIKYFYQVLLI